MLPFIPKSQKGKRWVDEKMYFWLTLGVLPLVQ